MSDITFERGGETMVLKMEHITGVAKFDATPSDIAAVLAAHPEIARQAGWIWRDERHPVRVVECAGVYLVLDVHGRLICGTKLKHRAENVAEDINDLPPTDDEGSE